MTTQPVNLDATTADLLDNCQTTKLSDDPTSQLSSHQSIDSPNHQNPQPPQPSTLTTHHSLILHLSQKLNLVLSSLTLLSKKEQLHHSPSQNTGPPPILLHSDIASNHPTINLSIAFPSYLHKKYMHTSTKPEMSTIQVYKHTKAEGVLVM
jgi:hypothetical protein